MISLIYLKRRNMGLRAKQSVFAKNISKLILWAYDNGYEITLGEVYRTTDQQLLYYHGYTLKKEEDGLKAVKTGRKSKTMNSKHLKKLALDINLFKDGKYMTTKEAFEPLAEKWSSLHPKNVSGCDWNFDYNHFQMSL